MAGFQFSYGQGLTMMPMAAVPILLSYFIINVKLLLLV